MGKEQGLTNKVITAVLAVLLCVGCVFGAKRLGAAGSAPQEAPAETAAALDAQTEPPSTEPDEPAETITPSEPNGDIIILYTSDIHCGLQKGFGVVGLRQIRESLEAQGNTVLLIDDGDAIQGEVVGTLTKGEGVVEVMQALQYDVAIPGNHEFDFGMDVILKIMKESPFPYISCNFLDKDGKTVLQPSVMLEAAGKKIGFIGVTTPDTMITAAPYIFKNEAGEFIYSFMGDGTGKQLEAAVQEQADRLRADGADYVVLMGHIGNGTDGSAYNYRNLLANTSGIDVMTDGHTHDTDQDTVINAEGKPVLRTGCGTKLQAVGCVKIDAEDGEVSAGLYSWNNTDAVPDLLSVRNDITPVVDHVYEKIDELMNQKIGETEHDLLIVDPKLTDSEGGPVRIVRSMETNMADLVTDSIRYETNAEIALLNAGGVRDNIRKGDITYGSVISVLPFNNQLCIAKVTGQQILDALEWGSHATPEELGGFLQTSGLTYEIDLNIESPCTSDPVTGAFVSVDGERRVKNVRVGGEPIDPQKEYHIATVSFVMDAGDGFSMFSTDNIEVKDIIVDSQALIEYIQNELNGTVGDSYSNPYGEGRIKIIEKGE